MCCRLHGSFAEAAAQQRAKVAKHRLAADDEDPGIHDGVEGVEAEGRQVRCVITKWANGVDKTCKLMTERVEVRHSLLGNKHETGNPKAVSSTASHFTATVWQSILPFTYLDGFCVSRLNTLTP